MEKIEYSLSVPVRTKRRSLKSSSSEKRQRSVLPKATMNIQSTSNIAAKTDGLGVSTSIKELDHEATVKCRFASIISKSKALCNNGSKKFDPKRMKQEETTFKRSLLDEKPMMEANVGLKRKRESDNGRKKAYPQRMEQGKPSFQRRKKAVIEARQTKANVLLKRQREMDRNAARMALEKMQNTAGIEMNVQIVKELNILSGFSLFTGDALQSIGLLLKDECLEFEEEIEETGITCTTTTGKAHHDIKVVRDNTAEKIDPEKMKPEEKEKSQQKLLDEKAMVDAELKRQREMDRNAARIALEKMENTAGIEINVDIEKELYILLGVSHSYPNKCRDGKHYVSKHRPRHVL